MSNGFGYKKGAFGFRTEKGAFGNVLYSSHDHSCLEANGGIVRLSSGMETIAFDENVAGTAKREDLIASAGDEHSPDGLFAADQSEFSTINRNGTPREAEIG